MNRCSGSAIQPGACFHRTTRETAEKYLLNRRENGFTVIQACVLAAGYWPGLEENLNGDIPFRNNDPLQPNESFFKYMDWIIQKADELGLYVGLLPTWGEYVCPGQHDGPAIFNENNAYRYGQWIANRYLEYNNHYLDFRRRPQPEPMRRRRSGDMEPDDRGNP